MERYRSFHRAMEQRFGRKIYKLALDAGMTPPEIRQEGEAYLQEKGAKRL